MQIVKFAPSILGLSLKKELTDRTTSEIVGISNWRMAGVGQNAEARIDRRIRNTDLYIPPPASSFDDLCLKVFGEGLQSYLSAENTYAAAGTQLTDEGYSVLRYTEGQNYKQHADSSFGSSRVISSVLFVNDDFTGGQLEFPNFEVTVTPKPGLMLFFPSCYAYSHVVHPVTSGTRYSIVTWFNQ